VIELDLGDQHVDRLEAVEDVAPQRPVVALRLIAGEQHVVTGRALRLDIVDRRYRIAVALPCRQPRRLRLVQHAHAAIDLHRQQQHRRRMYRPGTGGEIAARPRPVEHHAEPRDVARRREALALDFDARHHRIDRAVRQRGRTARRLARQPRPQQWPCLMLRDTIGLHPRVVGGLAAGIDRDPADRIGAGTVGRLRSVLRQRHHGTAKRRDDCRPPQPLPHLPLSRMRHAPLISVGSRNPRPMSLPRCA